MIEYRDINVRRRDGIIASRTRDLPTTGAGGRSRVSFCNLCAPRGFRLLCAVQISAFFMYPLRRVVVQPCLGRAHSRLKFTTTRVARGYNTLVAANRCVLTLRSDRSCPRQHRGKSLPYGRAWSALEIGSVTAGFAFTGRISRERNFTCQTRLFERLLAFRFWLNINTVRGQGRGGDYTVVYLSESAIHSFRNRLSIVFRDRRPNWFQHFCDADAVRQRISVWNLNQKYHFPFEPAKIKFLLLRYEKLTIK